MDVPRQQQPGDEQRRRDRQVGPVPATVGAEAHIGHHLLLFGAVAAEIRHLQVGHGDIRFRRGLLDRGLLHGRLLDWGGLGWRRLDWGGFLRLGFRRLGGHLDGCLRWCLPLRGASCVGASAGASTGARVGASVTGAGASVGASTGACVVGARGASLGSSLGAGFRLGAGFVDGLSVALGVAAGALGSEVTAVLCPGVSDVGGASEGRSSLCSVSGATAGSLGWPDRRSSEAGVVSGDSVPGVGVGVGRWPGRGRPVDRSARGRPPGRCRPRWV